MVKSNKTNIFKETIGLFASIYNFHKFEESVSKSAMMLYSFILLTTISIFSYFISGSNNIKNSFTDILLILIVIPILAFGFYGLFYIFLRAFVKEKKEFWEGFLVFLCLVFPFLLIGNIISFIGKAITNDSILIFLAFLLIIFFVYFVFNIVLNLKNYYNTTSFTVTTSLLLVSILITVFIILAYLMYIAKYYING